MLRRMAKRVGACGLICALAIGLQSAFGVVVRGEAPKVVTDVVYGHKDGMALTYDVFYPAEGKANGRGLLFMVSGGWVSMWAPPAQTKLLFQPMLDRGFTVIAVRHGSSPKYLSPEIVGDVRKALEHVTEHAGDYGVDPQKLGVFGASAGGHLSLMLGTTTNDNKSSKDQPHVAAVVSIFPPTDLRPYCEPSNPLREQFPALKFEASKVDAHSPLLQASKEDAPTLMVHGDKDELVPLWHSEKMQKAFQEVGVDNELIVIEGAAHGFNAEGNRRMYQAMGDWFEKHLEVAP